MSEKFQRMENCLLFVTNCIVFNDHQTESLFQFQPWMIFICTVFVYVTSKVCN